MREKGKRKADTRGFKHQQSAAQYEEAHGLRIAVTGSQRRLNQVNFFISIFFLFWNGTGTVALTLLHPHLSPVTLTPALTSPPSPVEHRAAGDQQREPKLYHRHRAVMKNHTGKKKVDANALT